MAFVYELGFCNEFGIPREYIFVSLTTVFIAVGSLLGVIAFIYYFFTFLVFILPNTKNPRIKWIITRIVLLFVLIMPFIIIFWGLWDNIILLGMIFIIFVFFLFLFPLLSQRKGSYFEKLEAQRKIDLETRVVEDYIIASLGWKNTVIVVLAIFFVILAHCAGIAKANKQTEFTIPSTYPNSVVLRVYGDSLICTPFSRTDNTTQKRFFIIKMGDSSTTLLNVEEVGPLQLAIK